MTKIYATGNEKLSGVYNISYYIIEKDDNFLDWLVRLLTEVFDISDARRKVKFLVREVGEEHEVEVYAKEISKMIDVHEHYSNKRDRVDIFYGKDRVYLTLRKSEEVRSKFAKFVRKTKEWVKIKETQEIPVYAKRVVD